MRTIRVALFELAAAVRTRRAIVLVALYLAASLLGMSGAITALGKMEDRLAEILQVEKVEGKVITNEELAEIRRKEREAAASDGSAESREGKAD